jgi:superfamily I DNA and RNA helicase
MAEHNTEFGGKTLEDIHEKQMDFLRLVLQNQNDNYYLKGCAGSGKTFIAALALGMISDKRSAVLLVYTKMLKNFIRDNLNDDTLHTTHYHRWLQHPEYYDTIIIDECQDFREGWINKVRSCSGSQIWLGDINQQIYSESEKDGGFETLIYNSENIVNQEFVVNYRNSISTANFAKLFMRLTDDEKELGIKLEEKREAFIKPILNNPKQTSGARNQPVLLIDCEDENAEYDCIAAIIKSIRDSKEDSKQIVIAQLHHDDLTDIGDALTERNIDYKRLPRGPEKEAVLDTINFKEDKDLVLLSTIHSLKGVEIDYIIFPRTEDYNIEFFGSDEINSNLLYTLFTRPKTRAFCSFTDKDRSVVYNQVYDIIDELDDIEKSFFTLVTSDEYLSGTEVKQSGSETYDDEGGPEQSGGVTEQSTDDIEDQITKYFKKLGGEADDTEDDDEPDLIF